MIPASDLQSITNAFIRTLQERTSARELLQFYHKQVEQTEYPNAVTKNKTVRDLAALQQSAEKGKKVMLKEEYHVHHSYTQGNTVIIEAEWTGTLAIPLGTIPAGGQLKANFAQFYEFLEGKIIRQRNYDCFEPF